MEVLIPLLTNVSGAYSVCLVRLSVCTSQGFKFCKVYSKTQRRSILISIYVVSNIYCSRAPYCPFVHRSIYLVKIDVWTSAIL